MKVLCVGIVLLAAVTMVAADAPRTGKRNKCKREQVQTTPETKRETTPETKRETTPETKRETTPETKRETTPETKRETTPETKRETTPETKRETTPETKRETTPETKRETTPETKRETTPETRRETTDDGEGISSTISSSTSFTSTTVESTTSFTFTWPYGTYGIMMAAGSCPHGARFKVGRRYQNLIAKKSKSNWNENSEGLSGAMSKQGFELVFCTKTDEGSEYDGDWPKGRYCIHRFGDSCPNGFNTGYITFDDKDNNNKNWHNGTLPDGVYDEDTTYEYCCRNDGKVKNAMKLHNTEPFYLYPFKQTRCQKIEGMVSYKESLKFDLENQEPENDSGGMVPKSKLNKDITLNLCLYFPM